jgi:hypothetical protein
MSTTHEFLRLIFDEYRWFRPMRYGFALMKRQIDPDRIDYDALLAYFNDMKAITVTARTERDFIQIFTAKPDAPPYVGKITWETSVTEAKKPRWRAAHLRQVAEVMRLVDSPMAQSGLAEDDRRKSWRIIPNPDGVGQQLVFTVRDYSEGLAGVYWRNFFGPPFVRLFGDRLASLPPGCTQEDLGGGIVLVQPYELPSLAGTPEGIARERALIEHLGPECFYDHERHLKPSRLPVLPPAPTTTGEPGQA